ncbi:hypothetical protein E3A20_29440, partial [Planctomyces bekefii]
KGKKKGRNEEGRERKIKRDE